MLIGQRPDREFELQAVLLGQVPLSIEQLDLEELVVAPALPVHELALELSVRVFLRDDLIDQLDLVLVQVLGLASDRHLEEDRQINALH